MLNVFARRILWHFLFVLTTSHSGKEIKITAQAHFDFKIKTVKPSRSIDDLAPRFDFSASRSAVRLIPKMALHLFADAQQQNSFICFLLQLLELRKITCIKVRYVMRFTFQLKVFLLILLLEVIASRLCLRHEK